MRRSSRPSPHSWPSRPPLRRAPLPTIPFGATSPFNLLVPSNPPIASNGGSLGASVGLAYAEYTPAVYVSSPSDPQYTIRLTSGWGPNALDGKKVRINPAARRANEDDGHMVIVVPQENLVISLYQAARGPSGARGTRPGAAWPPSTAAAPTAATPAAAASRASASWPG